MKLYFSRNRMRMTGIRRVRYSVLSGWSDAVVLYAYWFSVALTYGNASRKAY